MLPLIRPWNICYILREKNQEAYSLAKLAHSGSEGLRMFEIFRLGELGQMM